METDATDAVPHAWPMGVWIVALIAMGFAWGSLPDIPVTAGNGSGCGDWTADEIRRHFGQAPVLVVPVVIAQVAASFYLRREGLRWRRHAVAATAGTSVLVLVLVLPLSAGIVNQLLGLVVFPLFALWSLVALVREGSLALRPATLALIPPMAALAMFAVTRTPSILLC